LVARDHDLFKTITFSPLNQTSQNLRQLLESKSRRYLSRNTCFNFGKYSE
jgi:hypothetical protein